MKTYKINEIFQSIQGEGKNAGMRTIFVRFSGCNLKCPFCFGVKPGRKVPRLNLSNGGRTKIDEIKKGDVILTFNDQFEIVETTVQEKLERNVEVWNEIKIDEVDYFVTPEHPFFTNRGLIEAKDLKPGDQVYEVKHNGKEVQSNKVIDITKHVHYGRSYGPKPLKVHNVSCAPYNTYLIDNMWVHNCDTKHEEGTEYTFGDLGMKILKISKETKCNNVTFTGGEPLLQLDGNLVSILKILNNNFNFFVETNGTVPMDPTLLSTLYRKSAFIGNSFNVTCSPKLDHIPYKLNYSDYIKEYKIVLDNNDRVDTLLTNIKKFHKFSDSNPVIYIQPCEIPGKPYKDSVAEVYEYINENPNEDLRISVQTHKLAGWE